MILWNSQRSHVSCPCLCSINVYPISAIPDFTYIYVDGAVTLVLYTDWGEPKFLSYVVESQQRQQRSQVGFVPFFVPRLTTTAFTDLILNSFASACTLFTETQPVFDRARHNYFRYCIQGTNVFVRNVTASRTFRVQQGPVTHWPSGIARRVENLQKKLSIKTMI